MKKFLSKIIGSVAILGFLLPFIASAQSTVALPPQPGHAGEFLQTDGLNLRWAAAGGGGTITGGGTPGQVTYWDGATNITGDTNFLWNAANRYFLVGDPNNIGNGTSLLVNDTGQFITLSSNTIEFYSAAQSDLWGRLFNGTWTLGDVATTNNGTSIIIDDTNATIQNTSQGEFLVRNPTLQRALSIIPSTFTTTIGDIDNGGNGTLFTLSDPGRQIDSSAIVGGVGSYSSIDAITAEIASTDGIGTWGIVADQNGGTFTIMANADQWVWPNTDSVGTQALVSDGAGNLGWSSIGSGTIGGTINTGQIGFGSALNTLTSGGDLTWDSLTKTFATGDVTSTANNTVLIVNDDTLTISGQTTGQVLFGDINSVGNDTTLSIDDASQVIAFQALTGGTGTAFFGTPTGNGLTYNSGGNSWGFGADNTGGGATKIYANASTWIWPNTDGATGETLITDGAGQLSWGGGTDVSAALSATAATTANLAGAPTYINGVSGVGATLTRTGNGALPAQDGVTLINGDRLLVKNQVAQLENGIYEVTDIGSAGTPYILTRTTDSDEDMEFDDQIVVPANGTTQINQIFGQTTQSPVVGTDSIVYVTVTNTYVTQSVTGTQTNRNIPTWSGNPRQLIKGDVGFQSPGTNWLNGQLRLGKTNQGGKLVMRSGTNASNVLIGYLNATTANGFGTTNISAGGELRDTITGTTSTRTFYSNGGKRVEIGDEYLSFSPFDTGVGDTMETRFLELAASGSNYVGFKAADAFTGNVIWTLPTTDSTGTQALVSDGAGSLSWSAIGTGNVTGSGTSPRIPYWSSATALTDDANFTRLAGQGILLQDNAARFNIFINGGNSTASSSDNVAIGRNALDSITSGTLNIAIGKDAGTAINNGATNILIGDGAGGALVSGSDNVFIGHLTGNVATSSGNTGIGNQVLTANVGGNDNTAIGAGAMSTNISGNDNVAIGTNALTLSTATGNTAVGNQALTTNSSGTTNTAVGNQALGSISTNSGSTAMGATALVLTTGGNNTGLGSGVGATLTTGTGNTLIGQAANVSASSTTDAIALGRGATAATNEFAIMDSITNWKFQGDSYTLPTAFPSSNDRALVSSTAGVMTWGSVVTSGTYTPTLTNVANLDASTVYDFQWSRVGDVVTVGGRVDIDPTAAASTELGISLPIASNIAGLEGAVGTAFASGIAGQGAAILGDAANNRAQMQWIAVDTTNQSMYLTFVYTIIP